MIDPERIARLGWMILVGIAVALFGTVFFAMALVTGGFGGPLGVAIFILVVVFGLVMIGAGIISGLRQVRADESSTVPFVYPESRVIARFGINRLGEMIFTIEDSDIEALDYYVQLEFPDGRKGEFRAAWPVFCDALEGRRGESVIQGDMLLRFTRHALAPSPSENPFR
ncbi:MAG TPA: hypothetical protein PLH94_13240 [Fimbriimonadaceae bacterium]|nr:hypothetical protein [Fimbriimonadaceae bacterium]